MLHLPLRQQLHFLNAQEGRSALDLIGKEHSCSAQCPHLYLRRKFWSQNMFSGVGLLMQCAETELDSEKVQQNSLRIRISQKSDPHQNVVVYSADGQALHKHLIRLPQVHCKNRLSSKLPSFYWACSQISSGSSNDRSLRCYF